MPCSIVQGQSAGKAAAVNAPQQEAGRRRKQNAAQPAAPSGKPPLASSGSRQRQTAYAHLRDLITDDVPATVAAAESDADSFEDVDPASMNRHEAAAEIESEPEELPEPRPMAVSVPNCNCYHDAAKCQAWHYTRMLQRSC